VILILAVLLSIALPALQRARSAAASSKCQANLHGIGQIHQVYASERDGIWPTLDFPIKPNGRAGIVYMEQPWGVTPWGSTASLQIWGWAFPLQFHAGDADPVNHPIIATELFSCPVVHGRAAEQIERGILNPGALSARSYMYSPALYTSPSKWAGPEPFDLDWMFAPVRHADVRFPASKAVLSESRSYHGARETELYAAGGERFNILAADGHAERRAARESIDPVRLGGDNVASPDASAPFVATPRGALGLDW